MNQFTLEVEGKTYSLAITKNIIKIIKLFFQGYLPHETMGGWVMKKEITDNSCSKSYMNLIGPPMCDKTKLEFKGFKLSDEINFGRYNGKTIEYIIVRDPGYIEWIAENVGWFKLDKEAEEFLDACLQ